jgi:hypothetical protein
LPSEGPEADDLARKRRSGRSSLAGDHLDDGIVVRVELAEFESLVSIAALRRSNQRRTLSLAAVRPRPRKGVDRPERLPLHLLVQQFEEWVASQPPALVRVVKLTYSLEVHRTHRAIIASPTTRPRRDRYSSGPKRRVELSCRGGSTFDRRT